MARPVAVSGRGMLTGQPVTLRLLPAAARTGVVFVRTDLPGTPQVPACVDQVSATDRRTTLGHGSTTIMLVEHVLAALSGLRVDDCWVELDGPEPPGGDGSAGCFVRAIEQAGLVAQPTQRARWAVTQRLVVAQGEATIAVYPHDRDELIISYLLDYGTGAPIPPQRVSVAITPQSFRRAVADARTFLLLDEARRLHQQGLGQHVRPADVVVFGPSGPIETTLRFGDEPARHKILDMIGDLSLAGIDLVGHVVAYRSGHQLNIALARQLRQWHQAIASGPWRCAGRAA